MKTYQITFISFMLAAIIITTILIALFINMPKNSDVAAVIELPVGMKSNSRALTHVYDIELTENGLVYLNRAKGTMRIETPPTQFKRISADGSLIAGEDTKGFIWWKKIISDSRTNDSYEYREQYGPWNKHWLTYPLYSFLVPFVRKTIDTKVKRWAISHRSNYVHNYTDSKGTTRTGHYAVVLYELRDTEIRFYDPWVPSMRLSN